MTYPKQIRTTICERIAAGESLPNICKGKNMPGMSVVMLWLSKEPDFSEQYACARETRFDRMAEETLQIADTPELGVKTKRGKDGTEITEGDMTEHRRLRIETRKWLLSKLAPKRFGDKLTLGGDADAPLTVTIQRLTDKAKE